MRELFSYRWRDDNATRHATFAWCALHFVVMGLLFWLTAQGGRSGAAIIALEALYWCWPLWVIAAAKHRYRSKPLVILLIVSGFPWARYLVGMSVIPLLLIGFKL